LRPGITGEPRHLGSVCGTAEIPEERHVEQVGDSIIRELQIPSQLHREHATLYGVPTWLIHPEIRRQREGGEEFSQPNRLTLHLHRIALSFRGAPRSQ
jgi:hypothetical protein